MRICRVRREIRPCLIDEADTKILADEGEEQCNEAGERGNQARVDFSGIAAAHGAVQSGRQRRRRLLARSVVPGVKLSSRKVDGAPPQRIESLFAEKDRQTRAAVYRPLPSPLQVVQDSGDHLPQSEAVVAPASRKEVVSVLGYPPHCRHCSPWSAPLSHAARAASAEPICTELSDQVW
jgi:hypothetical protein